MCGQEIRWIAAMGFGGQRPYVVPSPDLAMLVYAGLYSSGAEDGITNMILNGFVLRAFEP